MPAPYSLLRNCSESPRLMPIWVHWACTLWYWFWLTPNRPAMKISFPQSLERSPVLACLLYLGFWFCAPVFGYSPSHNTILRPWAYKPCWTTMLYCDRYGDILYVDVHICTLERMVRVVDFRDNVAWYRFDVAGWRRKAGKSATGGCIYHVRTRISIYREILPPVIDYMGYMRSMMATDSDIWDICEICVIYSKINKNEKDETKIFKIKLIQFTIIGTILI